jgi:hypothetical protein
MVYTGADGKLNINQRQERPVPSFKMTGYKRTPEMWQSYKLAILF